ncbi:MAG: hypothetical protein GF335_01780 [Candidatus Moranbacteria bacterium]|nr:hypothetical protein [Candidatus Moranbacteria bacterium]
MKYSKEELKKDISRPPKQRKINLLFLGMSGAGKSYWSQKIAGQFGYKHFDIDDMLGRQKELYDIVKDYPGKDLTRKLGNYLGMPWTKHFQQRQKIYLELEKKLMAQDYPKGSILDLSGSSVYHPKELKKLLKNSLAIYLEVSEQFREKLFQVFLSDPKPIMWKEIFQKKPGQTNQKALQICYPRLLEYRAKQYKKKADVTLPFEIHRNLKQGDEFLDEVFKKL